MVKIPYGSKLIDVAVKGKLLRCEKGKSEGKSKRRDVVRDVFRNPINTKGLSELVEEKKGGEITIVVDDHTREASTEKMLDAIIEEIGEEYKEQVSLLVACGTHTPPSEEELKWILGKHHSEFDVGIHDCNAKDLVYLGRTSRGTPVILNKSYVEADIKVLTWDITLHYYAGFGGGRKSILPGISARDSLKKNHSLLVDAHARTANIENNPVHLDMSEAASFVPPDFVLNTIADAKANLVDAYAGEMNSVFLRGIEVAKRLFEYRIDNLFDILVGSAGGFPRDRNLYQATKALEQCYRAVVPGGKLILVTESREGIGDYYFEEWMSKYENYEDAEKAVRSNFVLGGHKAF
jgi:nickel-dependent lactate racemase